ncbi:MAG: hypothetical protein HYZ38_16045 [Mycobacterium sp.]|nr:hypothetical protein [Mycobacterium sp.]
MTISGDMELMETTQQGLFEKQDRLQSMVQQLGSALEGVAPSFKGSAQAALMRVGEDLQTMGNQQAMMQEDHAQKMGVSKSSLQEGDEDAASGLSAIDAFSV